MILPISPDLLERVTSGSVEQLTPHKAAACVRALGTLAPWWLRRDVLSLAAQHRPAYAPMAELPSLPYTPGSCWLILALEQPLPLLRPAFLLPLIWKPNCEHDPRLPRRLFKLAQQVQVLGKEKSGLHLADCLSDVDLRGLSDHISVDSGWASLAGGLLLLQQGESPNPKVWISAAWDDKFGVGPVQGLDAKLQLAHDWLVERFYVPVFNAEEARGVSGKHPKKLEIKELIPVAHDPQPKELLKDYLVHLGFPPPADAPLSQQKPYFQRVDRATADRYHWTSMLGNVIEKCRAQLQPELQKLPPTHVITIASNQLSVIAQGPAVLRAQQCLLLVDSADRKIKNNAQEVKTYLADKHQIETRIAEIRLGCRQDECRQVQEHLQLFLDGVPPRHTAFDLTPGFKNLSLTLSELAPAGAWLLYCRHGKLKPDNRVDPGTERYDCWRKPSP